MKFRKKVLLAGLTVLLLLITTVSTTFAWFSLNDAAWMDDFDLEIQSDDQLLIKTLTGNYKQSLTNDDVVEAYNWNKESYEHISKLSEISLSSVHSSNGGDFYKLQPTYDDMNKQTIQLVKADSKSYLNFTLRFGINSDDAEDSVHPNYNLKFSQNEEAGGIKKTSFTSSNQTIKLVNRLVTQEEVIVSGYEVVVNPVNALRLSVSSDMEKYENSTYTIYDLSDKNDLGSYAFDERTLGYAVGSENADKKYCSSMNAAFTYYNSIHNDILKPLGYYESNDDMDKNVDLVKNLINKIQYNFDKPIGEFEYDSETKSYNEVTLKFSLWLEGYDADNLIGLDTSKIKCLLSFTLEEEVDI